MKISRFYIIIAFIGLNACKKDLSNQSKLIFTKGDNFFVNKIIEGTDGNFYCSGSYRDPVHTSIQISRLRVYNNKLELLRELDWKYSIIDYLGDKGWILYGGYGGGTDTINFYLANNKIEIINRIPFVVPVANSLGFNVSKMKNGDLLIATSIGSASGNTCRISRLDANSKMIWDYSLINDTGMWGSEYILAKEAPDGNIFYTALAYISATPVNTYGALTGSLDAGGQKRFQRIYHWGTSCEPAGIIFSGDGALVSTISPNISISSYWLTLFNTFDGTVLRQEKLPSIYTEYAYKKENLSAIDHSDFGLFLENQQLNKLIFLRLDAGLHPVNTFPLNIPSLESNLSNNRFSFCYTSRGTIIVGTTYTNNGKIDFNLQEITTDGKVVR